MISSDNAEIDELKERLRQLDVERTAIQARIHGLEAATCAATPSTEAICTVQRSAAGVDQHSPPIEKIALFRRLFRGRTDIFPLRWENRSSGRSGYAPACGNEWKPGICGKPQVKCTTCPNQAFLPVADDIVTQHLRGARADGAPFVAGVYPLLQDNTCWFLAADFDKADWKRDVLAFAETARRLGVPAAVERSRSGNGGHAWIFFAEALPAVLARRLGAYLLTETLEREPDVGLASYDRFFPSQDSAPSGGFGNLIALPLQGVARRSGNSLFIDDGFEPYADQWRHLSSLPTLDRASVEALTEAAVRSGRLFGIRMPLDDEDEEPWLAPPSRRRPAPAIEGVLPGSIRIVQADQLYVPRDGLPSGLVARIVRIAAFQNPAFYVAQAMRHSTHDKPRVISCTELTQYHIALPRGCLDVLLDLFATLGVEALVEDRRNAGTEHNFAFKGVLRPEQKSATDALLKHEAGVLAATTAFGKTVVGITMIAARGRNTLILVHRRQLLDQWVEKLTAFLDLSKDMVGFIGGGRRRPTGVIDVALIQSVVRKGEVDDLVGNYGHVIVDECHHLSAVSFELVARRLKARYVLGLSATVVRKDGHHPIIAMQCGPIRYRADARSEAAKRPFAHLVRTRKTAFMLPAGMGTDAPIQQVYQMLFADEARNAMIFDDVLKALEAGRSPVILTERTDHLELLAARLKKFARNVVILKGGQGVKARRDVAGQLAAITDGQERVIVATARYIGEGFDDARLDTLFLTAPVAWRGTLAQYVGRLNRLHPSKRDVVVYDYVDQSVPVLARMAGKRRQGYEALGYRVTSDSDLFEQVGLS